LATYIGEPTIWLSFSKAIYYDNSFTGIPCYMTIPSMEFHSVQQFLQRDYTPNNNSFNRISHYMTIPSLEYHLNYDIPLRSFSSSFNKTLSSYICSAVLLCTLTFKEFTIWMKMHKTKSQGTLYLHAAV
jgi:hypothetical protein